MTLFQKIEMDMKAALKEGDATKVSVLRMLVAAIKTFELDKKTGKLDESDTLQILKRHIKQHGESIAQFAKGNRQDLVDKETKELKILESYMPQQLGEAEILNIVKEAISQTGATTKADIGKVMKAAMEKVNGKADGKVVNQIAMGFLR